MTKKVYFENLPKWEEGTHKGRINWTESIGHSLKFIYNDIQGEIKIINYNKDSRKLLVKYKETEKEIRTSQLLRCEIAVILGLLVKDYRYDIGNIIETLTGSVKILEQKRMKVRGVNVKAYKIECVHDGYINDITEDVLLRGVGCPVCSSKVIIKGINDIATTAPDCVKYFIDINDTYKYSKSAKQRVKLKCPECGHPKIISVDNLTRAGFSCSKCGDGVPYTEKFVANLLDQLNINFEVQKTFEWSKYVINSNKKLNGGKKYDFYIPSLNCIIETHGRQHYDTQYNKDGKSLEEEQENDRLKERLAKENGIDKYIVIDCMYSDMEWIRNSVFKSELNNIFDLSEIDWEKCGLAAVSSKLIEACKLFNEGLSVMEITKILKVSTSTVNVYLRKGNDLNLCERVNTKEPKAVIVYDLNQNELGIFNSIHQLARESEKRFGVQFDVGNISATCRGRAPTHKGFKFAYQR